MAELDVLIFPIPKLSKSTGSGIEELADIISKKENYPHILTKISQQEFDNGVLSRVEIPDNMFSRSLKSKTPVKKYKVEHVIMNTPAWIYVSKLDN